jgi:glycosyltransferase involved in cell wall biosynthesis
MAPSSPLRVVMASTRLPPPGSNATGTPAHVRKTAAAVRSLGAGVSMLEVDPGGAPQPIGWLGATARAFAALRTARADVVHVHGHLAALAVLPAARALSIPVLVELHGVYVASQAGQPGARPLLSRLGAAAEFPVLRRVDHVIAQARSMRDRIVAGGVDAERVTVLYPGLRTAEFADPSTVPAEIPGLAAGRPVAMYVGSTHAYQGLDLLAAAQRRLGHSFSFVLVLSRDAGEPEDAVSRFGFDPECTVVLHPDDPGQLPALLAAASVLVHARPDCPDNRNVQSKLGLYLASGRPIAATDVGDYGPLLAPSHGCRLSRPDPVRLALAIAAAGTDPDVAAAARSGNPAIARRHFESSENAAQLLRIYVGLHRSRRGAEPSALPRSAP